MSLRWDRYVYKHMHRVKWWKSSCSCYYCWFGAYIYSTILQPRWLYSMRSGYKQTHLIFIYKQICLRTFCASNQTEIEYTSVIVRTGSDYIFILFFIIIFSYIFVLLTQVIASAECKHYAYVYMFTQPNSLCLLFLRKTFSTQTVCNCCKKNQSVYGWIFSVLRPGPWELYCVLCIFLFPERNQCTCT